MKATKKTTKPAAGHKAVAKKTKVVKTGKKPVKPVKVNKPKKMVEGESEELEETPLLEVPAVDHEEHEILKMLEKKAPKPKPVHSIDYIPELERGEIDFTE